MAASKLIFGTSELLRPQNVNMVDRISKQEVFFNATGKAISMDSFLQSMLAEWEAYLSRQMENMQTLLMDAMSSLQLHSLHFLSDLAKVVHFLSPQFLKTRIPALFAQALDHSSSDLEISPGAVTAVAVPHRLLGGGGISLDKLFTTAAEGAAPGEARKLAMMGTDAGPGALLPRLDARQLPRHLEDLLLDFSVGGLSEWATDSIGLTCQVRANALAITKSAGDQSPAPSCSDSGFSDSDSSASQANHRKSLPGQLDKTDGLGMSVLNLLQKAKSCSEKTSQKEKQPAWRYMEQATHLLIVTEQRQRLDGGVPVASGSGGSTAAKLPSIPDARAQIGDAAAALRSQLCALISEIRDGHHPLWGTPCDRLWELERKVTEVAQYAKSMLVEDPAELQT